MPRLNKETKKWLDIINEIKISLHAIQADLNEHMRRTEILETKVDEHHEEYIKIKGFVHYAGWIIAGLVSLVPIISNLLTTLSER